MRGRAIGLRMRRLPRLIVTLTIASALVAGQPVLEAARSSTSTASKTSGSSKVIEIKVLSNRADLISGGDALVEIVLPGGGATPNGLRVKAGRRNVSKAFSPRRQLGGKIVGLVEGLKLGKSQLTARLPGGQGARITLTNHPIGGPVFSGPQVRPWICTTEDAGLGAANDKKCNAPTIYEFFYMSEQSGSFEPYDPDNPPPDDDVAVTTTDEGHEVPYIIRQETGTQNRGLYRIAVLFDPDRPWAPWAQQKAWNEKLFLPFGASCGYNHSQSSAQNVQNDMALSRGFMVAMSSLNVYGSNCNTTTSAEAAMMMKERIVERYGPIRYTISEGCSGGSISQHEIANAYPGLLQGLRVSCSYEDMFTGAFYEIYDCHMLLNYFTLVSPHLWLNPVHQRAVTGQESTSTCLSWDATFGSAGDGLGASPNPTAGCGGLDESEMYDPESNPSGCRGTYQDFNVAIFGRRPPRVWTAPEKTAGRGFAKLAYDNVGVQYGLVALEAGDILAEQFVDLNEKIGGIDIDYNFMPDRSVADPGAVAAYYRSGRVNDARQLDQVAIIDERLPTNAEFHTSYHSWALKQRLELANGHAENQVIWTNGAPPDGSFVIMDQWLSAVEADAKKRSLEDKIVANKPDVAVDACFVGDEMITELDQCRTMYPYYGAPRVAASGLLWANKILKCRLKRLDRADYSVEFTDEQWARLKAAFPDGVCDYSKPGVAKQPSIPWLSYEDGAGGEPLGPPPSSIPFRRGTRR